VLLESIVLGFCMQGSGGCGEATNAYYKYNKDLQQVVEHVEEFGRRITDNHKWLVYAASPIYSIAARKPASIFIYRGTTLNVDPWNQAVALQWNY
jgi:hypothetical protein